jgi:hypothetical protein
MTRVLLRGAGCLLVAATAALAIGTLQRPGAAPPRQSPLAAYPGFGHNPQADENRCENEERERENRIASCMQSKGFRYVPETSVTVDDSLTAEQAYAAADPNGPYIASLSRSEWRRYSLALAGVPDADDQSAAPAGGCIEEAYDAVPGVFAAYNALREPFERMQRRIATDRRVVAAERRWSLCMQSLGYSYRNPRELAAAPDGPDGASASAVALFEAATRADPGCRTQAGLNSALARARIGYETAFVRRYRTILDRFRSGP